MVDCTTYDTTISFELLGHDSNAPTTGKAARYCGSKPSLMICIHVAKGSQGLSGFVAER